jgi:hypothetical protein
MRPRRFERRCNTEVQTARDEIGREESEIREAPAPSGPNGVSRAGLGLTSPIGAEARRAPSTDRGEVGALRDGWGHLERRSIEEVVPEGARTFVPVMVAIAARRFAIVARHMARVMARVSAIFGALFGQRGSRGRALLEVGAGTRDQFLELPAVEPDAAAAGAAIDSDSIAIDFIENDALTSRALHGAPPLPIRSTVSYCRESSVLVRADRQQVLESSQSGPFRSPSSTSWRAFEARCHTLGRAATVLG